MPHLDLGSRPWFLAPTVRLPLDAALDDPGRLTDWLPARVPGTVQRDLMRAGRLPDLYRTSDLDAAAGWVDEQDWWVRSTLPEIAPEGRAWLRFEGVDYQAAVTLNGVELGRGAGMFAARQFEVTEHLRAGAGELGVRIWGGGALPKWPDSRMRQFWKSLIDRTQGGTPSFDDRLLTMKAQVHFGWDFAPKLLAVGIWDDVTLHTARGVGMLDVWARADWGSEQGMVIRLELDADRGREVRLRASLAPANFEDEARQEQVWALNIDAGESEVYIKWRDANLRPWSTHERGFPHLYRLHLHLEDDDGVLDDRETRVGARTIGWDAGKRLVLNGERLYLRGANWVPLDLLHGDPAEPDRYRERLQAAADAGVNALRIWGGGGRERRLFYDVCDELGILIWQEMPVACVFFDHLPEDEAFLALLRRETGGIFRQLRGHPSLFLWSGGNEWGPGRHKRLAAVLGETAAQNDPSRRWLPASPGPDDSHNWQVWHDYAPPARYAADPAPLLSEFGLAAPPSRQALAEFLPPDQLDSPGPAWTARKAQNEKLQHYASASRLGFIEASQEAQARGLQAGIEAYRLRADAVGTFLWQWNEPWPAICWSVIPYWGPPKRAYEQVRRSYAPIAPLARLLPDHIELWVVNDTLASPGECLLTAILDGREIWAGAVTPVGNGRVLVASIEKPARSARPDRFELLELRLTGPGIDARNDVRLDLDWREPRRWPGEKWLRERIKAWVLRW